MKKTGFHYCWLVLAGIILIRGFAGGGINMTSGLFLAPVAADIGVGIGSLSIYLSITSIVMVLWLPTAGKLINKYDIRIMAIAGAVLQALSFAALGLMNNVYAWYLLAVPNAMGASIVVSLLGPILINRWFTKNAGLMLGIQMAFVGLFGAVLQPFTSVLIASEGWRYSYFIIGGMTFVVVIASALLLLRNKPEDKGLLPYGADAQSADFAGQGPVQGADENDAQSAAKAEQSPAKGADENQTQSTVKAGRESVQQDGVEISEKEAVRSASFFLLLLFMIAITGVGVFTQHIPTFGGTRGLTIEETGRALAFASVGNAIGSIAIGVISDRIGSLKTCFGIIGLGLITVVGFMISGHSFFIFGLLTFLHGLTTSGIMVLAPILTIKFYGKRDYEKIYAKVSMGAPLASIILIPVYGFIYDLTKNYTLVLAGMIVLLLIAAFSITVGWKKRCTAAGCPAFRTK